LTVIEPSRRYWSLGFGVAYLVGAVLAGFNLDLVWDVFAWDGIGGQAHHLVSVLVTAVPHAIAIPGLALLIAGQRMPRAIFFLIALFPVGAMIAFFDVRFLY
jgi:hypothetical protein